MDAIEKRARELLAEQYRNRGVSAAASEILAGRSSWPNQMALAAIIAALTPPKVDMANPISVPDGFVLVPVEPTEAMKVAGSMWNTEIDEPPEFSALMSIWKDMLAARPGLTP